MQIRWKFYGINWIKLSDKSNSGGKRKRMRVISEGWKWRQNLSISLILFWDLEQNKLESMKQKGKSLNRFPREENILNLIWQKYILSENSLPETNILGEWEIASFAINDSLIWAERFKSFGIVYNSVCPYRPCRVISITTLSIFRPLQWHTRLTQLLVACNP